MWESRDSLKRRLTRSKHNRALRRKVIELQRTIEKYANKLEEQRWDAICTQMEGSMSGTRTWNLLRHLLEETNSWGYHKQRMATLIHNYQGTVQDPLSELRACHIDASPSVPPQEYPGDPNPEMDRPFTVAEVRSAALRVRK
ncbi:hypothetical protein HPB47_022299 [Ixodes persulcatus]|uniref:Uncharacterized protein n=1 Tax=Ixodes persulcatus TaxID=34615 RepID=A0AC60QA45_IXOPE|nr:hypothetical protein HPB47_022299 [Ixodes persulcatus]